MFFCFSIEHIYRLDAFDQPIGAGEDVEHAVDDQHNGQRGHSFAVELEKGREEGVGGAAHDDKDRVEHQHNMDEARIDCDHLRRRLQAKVARIELEARRPALAQHLRFLIFLVVGKVLQTSECAPS